MLKNRYYRIWLVLIGAMGLALLMTLFSRPVEVTAPAPDDTVGFGEFHGGPSVLTGSISGPGVTAVEVEYSMVDGLAIFEGDIIVNFADPDASGTAINVPGRDYRWPDGLIPYVIAPTLAEPQRVTDAIAHWEEHTSIRFVERTNENATEYPNYVLFQTGFGCSSYVGMVGGAQPINLAPECSTGATIHEIGHAVGLWHEQSRSDRDDYVTIRYENILPGYEYNFNRHVRDGEDMGPYDYASIMHYPRWAFSRNGDDTIVPHDESAEIGQRLVLSEGDIIAVEELYGRE